MAKQRGGLSESYKSVREEVYRLVEKIASNNAQ